MGWFIIYTKSFDSMCTLTAFTLLSGYNISDRRSESVREADTYRDATHLKKENIKKPR